MYFNLTSLLSLFCFILASSCSLKLNEQVNKKEIAVNPAKEGCLSKTGETLDKFTNGQIKEDELNTYWLCLEKAVVMFTHNTKGKEDGYYSPDEFSQFLTKYFLKGKTIPRTLVKEVMAIKVGFFGGSEEKISKEEFQKIIELLAILKSGTNKLLPYMPLLPRHIVSGRFTAEQFEDALIQFQLTMQKIGSLFESGKGSYKVARLVTLATEIESFLYDGPKPDSWTTSLKRWGDSLPTAKELLISHNSEEITPDDWQRIFSLAPRYYGLVLRSKYYFSAGIAHSHGQGLSNLEKLFDEFYLLLEYAVKSHKNETIQSIEIDKVLEAFHKNQMLPTDLSTAKDFLGLVFGKLLNDNHKKEYSITLATIQNLKTNALYASEGLRALQFIFKYHANENDFLDLSLDSKQITALPEETLLDATKEKSEISKLAVKSIAESANLTKIVFPAKSKTIYIPEDGVSPKFSYAHLSRVHLLRSLNRVLFKAYAKDINILNDEEIATIVKDVLPIVTELGLDKEKLEKDISKRLMEASLFLPASDGKKSLTATEAIELEALLLSTLQHGAAVHSDILAKCNSNPKADTSISTIEPNCYRKIFRSAISRYWWHVPGLAKHFLAKNDREREAYFNDLESFLRKDRTNERFTKGDSNAFVLLPYYIELLYLRFDRNKDGLLDNEEADAAFEIFQPLIAEKSLSQGITAKEDHHAIYMFLLAKQELPQNAKLAYFWRRYIAGPQNFKVDRTQVTKIFQKILSL
ncbi:MAG: hypothetical protein M9962_10240 [Oligoflexia bacterium]|nr:hypothetical protein [Oligoflexia bacterium]